MMTSSQDVYEVRPRKDKRGVDLVSDALPFGRLWYDGPGAVSNAIGIHEVSQPSRKFTFFWSWHVALDNITR
jgi:hypothetical protein